MNSSPVMKTSLLLLGIIVAGILIWANQTGKFSDREGVASQEFTGTLENYEGNVLKVSGIYTLEASEEEKVQEIKSVEIVIDPSTKITRTTLTLPSREELEKTNGYFETDKLKRVDAQVDLATLQKDTQGLGMGIFAKSGKNIFGLSTFTATELNYRVVTRP